MNAIQVWTIALVVALVVGVLMVARRLRRWISSAGGGLRTRVASSWDRVRDSVAAVRGVNLAVWPDELAEQVVGKSRPIPGGRVLPLRCRIRCGAELYGEASPYEAVVKEAFIERLRDIAAVNGWGFTQPRVKLELDESLHPRTYRLDMDFPSAFPGAKPGTTLFDPEPELRSTPPRPATTPKQRLDSDWVLQLPDGRRHVVPLDATLTMGSGTDCDIVLASKYVSRVNTTVTAQGTNLLVRDGDPRSNTRSTNGTIVDGHHVKAFTLTPQIGEATVVLGGKTTIKISLRTAQPRTTTEKSSGS